MIHRPWQFAKRLSDRMADSSLLDNIDVSNIKRPPRSEGLHASELLRIMHPVKEGKGDDAIDEEQLRLFGLLGLAFEDRAELALISLAKETDWPWYPVRPGEVEAGGIACSPDILLVPKVKTAEVRELSLKSTWKSCRGLPVEEEGENGFPKSFDYYISQCMTYTVPLETMGSVLFVYFVCGSWRPPFPQVHAWELDFSDQEIAENWDALQNIAVNR